ncbi:MAG: polysaccharide deacetylase family protein [Proteobacteria bacterium]|nr:polysaccharide deacetylase family protein [Pseudomonadota bacterium]MBS0574598.1 polysaccharide deacetylase family protein [Pseudomonadota bacterium]
MTLQSPSRRALLMQGLAAPVLLAGLVRPAQAVLSAHLVEPHMRLAGGGAAPRVALTLDACDGHADRRILDLLLSERIAATIFVAGPWLARNHDAFARLLANPDLIEIGNHGARHRSAIEDGEVLWGVRAAGSAAGVEAEVRGGADLLVAAGAPRPRWYRDATARYSPDALALIAGLGCRVAGFSLNADQGASLGAAQVRGRIAGAEDGAVIIAHVNQPGRSAGAGVAEGLRALKERGVGFVRLSDVGVVPVV